MSCRDCEFDSSTSDERSLRTWQRGEIRRTERRLRTRQRANFDCELRGWEGREGGRNRRTKHICWWPRRIWIRERHSLYYSDHNRRICKLSLASYMSLCVFCFFFVAFFLLLASSRTLFFEANLPNLILWFGKENATRGSSTWEG